MRPLIGISCCVKPFGTFGTPNHAASDTYVRAVRGPVGGAPILLPAAGADSVADLVHHLDGLLLTGSRSNVCPVHYDGPAHAEGTPEDHDRDRTNLALIRACLAAGVPILAICRGFQELNVALGGSLDQRVQDLPGRLDHSTPSDQPLSEVRTGKAHAIRVAPGTLLAELWSGEGALDSVAVNSLHNQGLARLAGRLHPEAWAPDGTPEAVSVRGAGFALGVQWHPEYDWRSDPLSRRLFEAFGHRALMFRRSRAVSESPPLLGVAE